MFRIALVALLAAPLVSACALIPARASAPAAPVQRITVSTAGMRGALEPVHAAAFINDQAVFRVSSGGCTSRDDIEPVVTRSEGGEAFLTLRRINEDYCRAYLRDGAEVIWDFEELGLAPGERVRLNNPYRLSPTDG